MPNEYDDTPFDPKDCVLDTARFFDSETDQWGYEVMCLTSFHKGPEPCPGEREIFRC